MLVLGVALGLGLLLGLLVLLCTCWIYVDCDVGAYKGCWLNCLIWLYGYDCFLVVVVLFGFSICFVVC